MSLLKPYFLVAVSLFAGNVFTPSLKFKPPSPASIHFPYAKAGLTDRQAAAHLLSRFTFGARPGEVDEVVHTGLERWFVKQLKADQPDDTLDQLLSGYDALPLSNDRIADVYPKRAKIVRMAVMQGLINKDSIKTDKQAYRNVLLQLMQQNGFKPQRDLFRQLIIQKILRATYGRNQLQEVMTSFWFNHFNVALIKNDCAEFIPSYERTVIRPRALGNFEDLLIHTAQSPAMLYYLDNFSSTAPDSMKQKRLPAGKARKNGLNENYAREVMELHTLGVDGNYSQNDVTEAARVLTGWTVYPLGNEENLVRRKEKITIDSSKNAGWVHQGDFLFNPHDHDWTPKKVLGHSFTGTGGYQEGVDLLHLLANDPATARFICHKIAVRFVCDTPSTALTAQMAAVFIKTHGDIPSVLLNMVQSREFWTSSAVGQKIKSPFELAVSSARSLNAKVSDPIALGNWVARMGEKMYNYQAPTGYPDRGRYWINTGSLLNRMNFGLAFAAEKIRGVSIDLLALNHNHEPESAVSALQAYGKLMVPFADTMQMRRRLSPLLSDPALPKNVSAASQPADTSALPNDDIGSPMRTNAIVETALPDRPKLAQVIGVLIGSPEFQRR